MQVLVEYDDSYYLVDEKDGSFCIEQLSGEINADRWPDELQSKEYIRNSSRVICFMNDDARIV